MLTSICCHNRFGFFYFVGTLVRPASAGRCSCMAQQSASLCVEGSPEAYTSAGTSCSSSTRSSGKFGLLRLRFRGVLPKAELLEEVLRLRRRRRLVGVPHGRTEAVVDSRVWT